MKCKRPLSKSARLGVLGCAVGFALTSGASIAQTTGQAADSTESSNQLAEIIVTAEKREERLQDAPLSVVAVSQAQMTEMGIENLENLTKLAPDLRADVQIGNYTVLGIRGLQPNTWGPNAEGSVTTHIDGVYLPRIQGLQGFLYDTQRVEVLSGPQGTLFGRNSTAGVVNIIPIKPQLGETDGNIEGEYGSFNTARLHAAVNFAIGDDIAIRIAGRYYNHTGYYTDTGLYDANDESVRAAILWKPAENTTLTLTADREHNGGKGGSVSNLLSSTPPTPPSVPLNVGVTPPTGPWQNANYIGDAALYHNNHTAQGVSAQLDQGLSFATLTVQASIRSDDLDGTTGGSTGQGFGGIGAPLQNFQPTPQFFPSETVVTGRNLWNQQEIRLASNPGGEFQWVAGLFRFDTGLTSPTLGNSSICTTPLPGNASCTDSITGNLLPAGTQTGQIIWTQNGDTAYAAFGQATWTPQALSALHITGGLRENHDHVVSAGSTAFAYGQPPYSYGPNVPNGPTSTNTGDVAWSKLTYTGKVAYDLTQNNMVYVSQTRGWKAGSFSYGPQPEAPPSTNDATEIGSKNEFLDRRLQVNGAVWYYNIKNYDNTVGIFDPAAGGVVIMNASAQKVRDIGSSIDVQALPTNSDRVAFNATYTDVRYIEYTTPQLAQYDICFIPGVPVSACPPLATLRFEFDSSDTPVGNAPKWTANLDYDHTFTLPTGKLDLGVSVNYRGSRFLSNSVTRSQYLSGYNAQGQYDPDQLAPSYTTADLTLRYAPRDRHWSVMAYDRNLTNKLAVSTQALTYNGAGTSAWYTGNYIPPRVVGVVLTSQF
jgi:iron complex outermembrane recepter protein